MRASRRSLSLILASALAIPGASAAQEPATPATPATPAAELAFDVNGDGAPDRVRVEPPGAVHVTLSNGRELRVHLDAPPGTLRAARLAADAGPAYGGRRVIIATGIFAIESPAQPGARADGEPGAGIPAQPGPGPEMRGSRHERRLALVLTWRESALVPLWQGPVGPRGRDGDHEVRVETSPLGLLRYQFRPDVQRCDGQPAYLSPEVWDFRSGRFRPVYNLPRIPDGAPVLTARRQAPAGVDGPVTSSFRTRAASTQAGAADAGDLAPPRELDDGDPATAWRERLGGDGRGEFITLTTTLPGAQVAAVRLIPGDASSPDMFRRSNRLRRAGLLVGDRAFWIEIPGDPAGDPSASPALPYWVLLPEPVPARCVTLVLDTVYPGASARSPRTGDTALSELAVLTTLDLDPAGAEVALVARVRAGGEDGRAGARLLAERGPRATAAVLQALEAGVPPVERLRLRRVLARIGDPAGAAELVEGVAAETTPAADRDDFAAALVRMGDDAVTPLAGLLADEQAASPARRAAARALGTIPGASAREALVAAAGHGPRPVRRAVALALAGRDPGDLDPLLDATALAEREGNPGREADLWRALGLMIRHAGEAPAGDTSGREASEGPGRADRAAAPARARAIAALAARLDTAGGYELSYRLLDAAGPLPDGPVLGALAAALARLPGGAPETHALRRVAAAALARNPAPGARDLLVDMADAADPGVRRAAADALASRADADATTDQVLIDRLAQEDWPRIRGLVAVALGRRCGTAEAPAAALAAAVDRDADTEVRRSALSALVACRAPGTGPRLLQVAADAAQPPRVRQRAITLVAVLGDRGLAPELIELFGALRRGAWSDAEALRLAAAAAVTLGRLGDPAAVEPLMAAARDPAFAELQAAAITGLGEMCPPRAVPLFERARRSGQRAVSIAARRAHERCAR